MSKEAAMAWLTQCFKRKGWGQAFNFALLLNYPPIALSKGTLSCRSIQNMSDDCVSWCWIITVS